MSSKYFIPSPESLRLDDDTLSIYSNKNDKGYKVPIVNANQLISGAKLAATAALYGIGIGKAIVRYKLPKNNQEYDLPTTQDTPDAYKTATGYEATDRWDGRMASSLIGMPVMSYIKFIGGSYIDLQGRTITIPDVTFETVLMTITMRKNIVFTDIVGRDTGSIKEYIGQGDWNVDIRAIITADAPVNENVEKRTAYGVYPRDNMREIFKILTAPIAIPVESPHLQQFGINYLVVSDGVQIDQIEGEYEMQRILIPCVSDNPLIIKFTE